MAMDIYVTRGSDHKLCAYLRGDASVDVKEQAEMLLETGIIERIVRIDHVNDIKTA